MILFSFCFTLSLLAAVAEAATGIHLGPLATVAAILTVASVLRLK